MKRKILLCSTISAALVCGCVSVSKSDSLEVNKNDLAISIESAKNGETNFRIRSIVRNLDSTENVDVDGHGHKQLQRNKIRQADWPALRDAIAKRMDNPAELFFNPFAIDEQPLAPHRETVPVDIVVNETFVEDVETPTKGWTTLLSAFSVGVFPAIWTSESECHLSISFPASSCSGSGQVRRNTWISWFTLPWLFVPEDRETPVAEALSEVIVSKLTPERYRQNLAFLEAERTAAERLAEEERAAAERMRREEEERLAAAERAKREDAERWLARKDDPAYKFPLRASFPDSAPVYKEFRTGCSLAWAEEYIRREGYATTNRVRSFPDMAVGFAGATERPLPEEFDRVEETETSLFVHSPTNITFFDDGRFVTLTFGSPSPDGAERVLVSGEIQFTDGGATVEALAKKYEAEVPGSRRKASEETVTEGGQTILPLVRLPVYTIRKALVVLSSEKAAVRILDNRAVSLFWDSPSSQQIHVDEEGKVSLGNDDLELRLLAAPQLSGEEVGKAFAMWSSSNERCGKPAVSIVDRPLFRAMVSAKEEAARAAAAAQRKEREDAAERRRREMEKRLESF